MNKFIAIPLIVLIAGAASANSSPNERFNLALDKIKSIQSKLDKDRQSARDTHDSILFACINDASHQVYAATKGLEGKYFNPSEQDATTAEDILSKVSTIALQADSCLGSTQLVSMPDGTNVSMTTDSSIAPADTDTRTPPLITEPPACASCYR